MLHAATSGDAASWHFVVGYFISVVVGGVVILLLMKALGPGGDIPGLPRMVGVVERVLYTASWQVGKPEFIAVWLALKTVQRLQQAPGDVSLNVFNVYLIGNAFSVGFGVLGGLTIDWLASGHYGRVLWVVGAAMIGSAIYIIWAELGPGNDLKRQSTS